MNKFQIFKSGQSLVEVLIAFGVTVVLGVALISAGLVTQRASLSARNKSQATKLAQGYLEQVRIIRDLMGATAFNNLGSACYTVTNSSSSNPDQWSLGSGCTGGTAPCNVAAPYNGELIALNNVNYCRKITLSAASNGARPVQIDVSWKEGVNDRIVSAKTVLSKWCEGKVNTSGGSC